MISKTSQATFSGTHYVIDPEWGNSNIPCTLDDLQSYARDAGKNEHTVQQRGAHIYYGDKLIAKKFA
jgi:hypothetical protein